MTDIVPPLAARPEVHVLFTPASGPGLGGGHVMRCLSLAAALVGPGVVAHFGCRPAGLAVATRFAACPFVSHPVETSQELVALAARLTPDAVVLDDYRAAAPLETALRPHTRLILAVDDLADRPHTADLVLDPGYGRRPADYARSAPDAKLWLGPSFALLRPGFSPNGARRPARDRITRLFVSFGLSDVDEVTARSAAVLLRVLDTEAALDVALASDAPSLVRLRAIAERDARLRLHVDATDVAPLIAAANLGVGAGGSTLWERASLGLASITVAVADNQRPLVKALAEAGAHLALDLDDPDYEASLTLAVRRLADPILRDGLARAAQALCDGRGAERAAQGLLARLRASA